MTTIQDYNKIEIDKLADKLGEKMGHSSVHEDSEKNRKKNELGAWFTAVSAILPGDHIHSVAPSSTKDYVDEETRQSAISEAENKRLRKQARNLKLMARGG